MKKEFYKGKETSTNKSILVLKEDFDALPREKAILSLLDMGMEVNTDEIVIKEFQDEDFEMGIAEYFD